MESLITTRDLHEKEFSVQQAHSFDVEAVLPLNQHTKGVGETVWMDAEHTVVVILRMILLIIFCVFGTLTNSLVFWVFNRRPALRSLSNRFVLSLVTANLLISSIIAPLMLFETILDQYIPFPCIPEVISMISSSVIFSAVFSTFLIATDRFYAVTSPLHYSMTITRSRSQIMIVFAWLSGVLLAMPYIIICSLPPNTELHQSLHVLFIIVQLALGYIFPFVGLCWLYLRMYHAAHRNSERTRKHSISGELLTVMDGSTSVIPPQGIDFLTHYMNPFTKAPMTGSIQGIGLNAGGSDSRNGNSHHGGNSSIGQIVPAAVKKQRRRSSNGSSSSLLFREEGRAIKTAFLVLASFLLCWTPHFAFMLMSEIDIVHSHLGHLVMGSNLPTLPSNPTSTILSTTANPISHNTTLGADWVRFFGVFGILLSCLLNPFIYVFRNKMACKEVSKLLCRFFREKRRLAKQDAVARERHYHLTHQHLHSRDQNDIAKGGAIGSHTICTNGSIDADAILTEYHPQYTPCIGKSPKRSSLKSLTPQSSINSTMTNCNSITNVNSPINGTTTGILSGSVVVKPPFIRSMTVPEQSQPRVKFPPNLVRQKSCIHRPVYGGTPTELTPALSKRSKFVRQDSICSILSNDSVLMICAEDGLTMSDIGLLNRSGGGGGSITTGSTNVVNGSGTNNCQVANGSITSGSGGGGSSNLSSGGTPLPRNYLRQDSNFSDASHKTNDSGIVLSMCPCSKQSSTDSPFNHHYYPHNHCQNIRNQSPNHLSTPKNKLSPKHNCNSAELNLRQHNYPVLQTTI